MLKKCELCNKEFNVRPSRFKTRKYCSKHCHNKSMEKVIEKQCPICKKMFEIRPFEVEQIYCSRACVIESTKINIPYEEIYELYVNQHLPTREVGKKLGVSKKKVLSTLREYSIEVRDGYTQRKGYEYEVPSKKELESLYWDKYLTYEEIAEIYDMDASTTGLWIKDHGIKTRVGGEGKKGKNFIMPTKQEIEKLYFEKDMTATELAIIFGTSNSTICKIIKDYGLTPRPNIWQGRRFVKCKDGHEVRSNLERVVDDYLYDNDIEHVYEKRLPGKYYRFKSDFFANGKYIEVWGVINNKQYDERRKKKEQAYKDSNLELISIEPEDFLDENILFKKLSVLS